MPYSYATQITVESQVLPELVDYFIIAVYMASEVKLVALP